MKFLFWFFFLNALPVLAQLPTPQSTLELDWEAVPGASGYEVQLTPTAGGPPIIQKVNENKISSLVPAGTYFLKIRSRDKISGYFGPWSAPTEIEVVNKVVELISPKNEEVIPCLKEVQKKVQFTWSPATDAKEYQLKVWSDNVANAQMYPTTETGFSLDLSSGKTYFWQVTFKGANLINYQSGSKTFTFTLLGRQLAAPVFAQEDLKKLMQRKSSELIWQKSPEAETYDIKFYRHSIDETEWQEFLKPALVKTNGWQVGKLKPGDYRVEIIAKAPRHSDSTPGTAEFTVKPSDGDLAKALDQTTQLLSGAVFVAKPIEKSSTPKANGSHL